MELAMVRSRIIGTFALTVLAACGGGGGGSSYQSLNPVATGRIPQHVKPNDVNTCATSPPQYHWIFEGACQAIEINSNGAAFSLDEYRDITVTGAIGLNTLNGTVQFDVVDAVGNGDIEHYNDMTFPHYTPYSSGSTVIYVAVINQSNQNANFVTKPGKAPFMLTVTDADGFPAKRCGLAVYDYYGWNTLYNVDNTVYGDTVSIAWFDPGRGQLAWPSKYPVYFAVYCPYTGAPSHVKEIKKL